MVVIGVRFPSGQVQKHTEKLQREKEDAAFKNLSASFPDLGKTVLAHALQECNWEADQALKLLERFHSAAADILENLKQVRTPISFLLNPF